jgi:hypothetical protein
VGRWIYVIGSLAILAGWVVAAQAGWSPTEPAYVLPPSVRQSPGGYRSFHFWHSGYQPGK